MPSRMSVAQQSGVVPLQSLAPRHAMVSAGRHVGAQVGTSFVRSAQQVDPPEQGMVGHVAPPSPGPPLLEPLLLPEPVLEPLLLPEPVLEPLPLPEPPPLELEPPEPLPDDASPALASAPEPVPGLLLPEQAPKPAAARTRADARRTSGVRSAMPVGVPRVRYGNIQVTVKPALLSLHWQPAVDCERHEQEGVLPHFAGYIGQL
jgi:hypothetical protein